MSGENEKEINTSGSEENNSITEEKGYTSVHSNSRIKGEQNQITEQKIPSEDLGYKKKKDIADVYPTKKMRIFSCWRNEEGIHSNITNTHASKSIDSDSNLLRGSAFNHCQDDTQQLSCSSNAEPEAIDEADEENRENNSTYIFDEDLADAGPSCVTCDVCNQTYEDEYLLDQHKPIHASEKPFSNEITDHTLFKPKLLNISTVTHTKKKGHQCDQCPKTFPNEGNLLIHKRIHTGDRPYECEKCNKKFTRKGSLNTHLRSHTGEKPYQCEECLKKFSQKGSLNTHLRIHSGDKPYKCEKCGNSYSDLSHFRKHCKKCRC